MGFGQFASTSQFYLYGRKHCTKTGYDRHRKQQLKAGPDMLDTVDLGGKVCMVTGANSGVGFEVASFLAAKGATLYMVCRSEGRGEEARRGIVERSGNSDVHLLVCDCSLEADVRRVWSDFASARAAATGGGGPPALDVLVCNAGVLLNSKTMTREGVETTFACHLLFGTYLLTELAMGALEATAGARVVVVSSGGMYNTKFDFAAASGTSAGAYSGNMAYAYAKRGQVLLCERWSETHPSVAFVTCHPGWTATPAVDEAYGDMKKYLEPLRSPWEGAEGIAWLCAVDASALTRGAFYLDRRPEPKHLAGPFFSEGSFTKNSRAEVDAMVAALAAWASAESRPSADAQAEMAAALAPLVESSEPVSVRRFVGRWYVVAAVPTALDRGAHNPIEDYTWNEAQGKIEVVFSMRASASAPCKSYRQRATIANRGVNTRWALSPLVGGVRAPVAFSYLILDCAPDYSTCMIGVPNRSLLYIMARAPELEDGALQPLVDKARRLGYDLAKLERPPHDYAACAAPPPQRLTVGATDRLPLGVAHAGKPRVCMALMTPSHHSARAKAVLDAITDLPDSGYETWCIVFKRGAASPYYDYVEALKAELPETQRARFEGRKGWSAPFVWLELPDGSRDALGGRDDFCAWALRTFEGEAGVRKLAASPPRATEAFGSVRRLGSAQVGAEA